MKALIAKDTLLRYPDHNKPFHIYTDASDYQLGSVIMQDNKPVAYYSRKLTGAQRNYTTMEKELLSVIVTLQEFKTTLLGAEIHVFTDHKNLTYSKLTSQRVLRWRLFLEDFSPTFHYIKGNQNVLADTLSRLEINENIIAKEETIAPQSTTTSQSFCLQQDNPILFECFMYHPQLDKIPYPIDYTHLLQHQKQDKELIQEYQHNSKYILLQVSQQIQLIAYKQHKQQIPKIVIPKQLLQQMIVWYHLMLNHAATTRLFQTIHLNFYHPNLYHMTEYIVQRCSTCQLYKIPTRGY